MFTWTDFWYIYIYTHIPPVATTPMQGEHVWPKFRENIFRANVMKIRPFSGKYCVQLGHFVNFSYTHFRVKMSCPPQVDSDPTPMSVSEQYDEMEVTTRAHVLPTTWVVSVQNIVELTTESCPSWCLLPSNGLPYTEFMDRLLDLFTLHRFFVAYCKGAYFLSGVDPVKYFGK